MKDFEGFEGFPQIEMWCAVHCVVVWSLWLYHHSPQLKKNLKIPTYYLFLHARAAVCKDIFVKVVVGRAGLCQRAGV